MKKIPGMLMVLVFACLGRQCPLMAQTAVMELDSGAWVPYPEKYMEYVTQPDGANWTLQAVQALPESAWRPLDEDYGAFWGITTRGHWLRFRLHNQRPDKAPLNLKFSSPEADSLPLLLECNNPNVDTLDFYRVGADNSWKMQRTGNRYPPEARPLPYLNPVFRWKEPAGASATIYLYTRSLYYSANLTFSLWDERKWQLEYKQLEILASVLFFALVLVYLITLTLLFAIVRQMYLWLFYCYVLLGALFIANDLGIWYWMWRWFSGDYRIITPVLLNLSTVCGLLFVRYHFHTQRRYHYFDWSLVLLCATALATSALSLLLCERPEAFMGLYKVLIVNLLATCAATTGLVLYNFYQYRKSENIWFVIAFTPHGLAVVFTCLHQLDVLHPNLPGLLQFSATPSSNFVQMNTPWLLLGGMLWEMLIVSMLFVVRIKDFYESANRVLAERRNALVLGVETERKRVAQEIHDGIGVLLSSTKMKLAALRERIKDQSELYRETGDLVGSIDQAHEEMRALAYNLMPKSLEKLGLAQAIEGTVGRLRRNHPAVQWHFYCNFQNGHLDELTKINLFRIAQEMLHNVLIHARATEAHLQLLRQGDRIVLSMEDNGVGFQPRADTLRTGIGLSNIRYRAEDVLKGHVSIESSPGKGAFVAVEIPV